MAGGMHDPVTLTATPAVA